MIGSLELLASLRVEGGRWGETADFQLRNAKRVLTLGGRCTFITLWWSQDSKWRVGCVAKQLTVASPSELPVKTAFLDCDWLWGQR